MSKTRTERTEWPVLLATAAGRGLASLPIGSLQSRAAARSLLADRKTQEGEGTIVRIRRIGFRIPADRKCTCPIPSATDIAVCRCFV